ncbi:MAG: alpha/beta fold hydrolase, partial [Fidelibacterota bacterium]
MKFENIFEIKEIRKGRDLALYRLNANYDKHIYFIHGAGGRADQWLHQVEYFKDQYQITLVDLLGHGRSPKEKMGYTFSELFKDVEAVFQENKCTKNIIIAHSYGVAFALHLFLSNTSEIQKLILIGANQPRLSSGAGIWNLPAFILEWMRPIFSKGFVKGAFHPKTNQEFVKKEQSISDNNPMFVMKQLIKGMREMPGLDLGNIPIPILIINGEADGLTPVSGAKELSTLLPKAELIVVEKASHLVMMEQPETVNKLIRDFINQSA